DDRRVEARLSGQTRGELLLVGGQLALGAGREGRATGARDVPCRARRLLGLRQGGGEAAGAGAAGGRHPGGGRGGRRCRDRRIEGGLERGDLCLNRGDPAYGIGKAHLLPNRSAASSLA